MNQIKVLWFSNTPANADEYFNSELKNTGGWLKSLDKVLQYKVDLHVVYYGNHQKPFKYLETTYHPIDTSNNLCKQIKNKFCITIPTHDDLNVYLDLIDQIKPDIIHIHGSEMPFAGLISHTVIPVVVSI